MGMNVLHPLFLFAVLLNSNWPMLAQRQEVESRELPGKGLFQHPFLYAGEWQHKSMRDQKMYLVKEGKVVWTYTMPQEGEYGDAFMLSNGNIVFSRKEGASEITQEKVIVWNFDAPPNAEIHTCQPLGLDRVFVIINAVPAKAVIIKKADNTIEKEFILPTGSTKPHSMFRHCRYTRDRNTTGCPHGHG